jgi:rare lipoprotein A
VPISRTKTALAFRTLRRAALILTAATVVLLAVGCHHTTQQAYQPPPPPLRSSGSTASNRTPFPIVLPPVSGKAVLVETGLASWYGASGHRTADGSVYDGTGLTAAHRTLALGTTVRVTNLTTGQQVDVRITDRGPFSESRILDLSVNAAKAIGLYRAGVAKVRLEAFANPAADPAGRWCVQTGAFKAERDALDLKSALVQRFRGARVTEFSGATGFWVRIDPPQHTRSDALAIVNWISRPSPEAVPYLLRLD